MKQPKTIASCCALTLAVAVVFPAMPRADSVVKSKYLVWIMKYL